MADGALLIRPCICSLDDDTPNRLLNFSRMPSASKPFFGLVGLMEARSGLKNPF
jgi:hypothetical protein